MERTKIGVDAMLLCAIFQYGPTNLDNRSRHRLRCQLCPERHDGLYARTPIPSHPFDPISSRGIPRDVLTWCAQPMSGRTTLVTPRPRLAVTKGEGRILVDRCREPGGNQQRMMKPKTSRHDARWHSWFRCDIVS